MVLRAESKFRRIFGYPYGPWMPRQGDNFRATLDLVDAFGNDSDIQVDIVTKNSEDPGNGTLVGTFINRKGSNLPGTPRVTGEWTGLAKELVRYKFTVKGGPTGTTAGQWVLFRMVSPVWFDTVGA